MTIMLMIRENESWFSGECKSSDYFVVIFTSVNSLYFAEVMRLGCGIEGPRQTLRDSQSYHTYRGERCRARRSKRHPAFPSLGLINI